jgi:hypothetical protein
MTTDDAIAVGLRFACEESGKSYEELVAFEKTPLTRFLIGTSGMEYEVSLGTVVSEAFDRNRPNSVWVADILVTVHPVGGKWWDTLTAHARVGPSEQWDGSLTDFESPQPWLFGWRYYTTCLIGAIAFSFIVFLITYWVLW